MLRPMKRLVLTISFAFALVAAGCGGAPPVADAPTDGPADARLPAGWADSDERLVTVLATLGQGHARSDAWGFDEVEAVLAYWEPDLVLVDVPPTSLAAAVAGDADDDVFLAMHPEVTEVVLPRAADLGYAVQAIGGATLEGLEDRQRWDADNPAGPPNRLLIAMTARLRALWIANEAENNPLWLHGDEYLEASWLYFAWLLYEVEEDLGADGELRRMARTTRAMGTILDTTDARRVLILVNPGARWFVEGMVDAREDVRRVPGASLFRP